MRIVAGQLRGRNLTAPSGSATRPTSDRARQALFNILEHGAFAASGSPLAGASVLDAFAGSGALGLEALSRGATSAVFFEQDQTALACLRDNIARLGQQDRARVIATDCLRPPSALGPCTIAFLDPPYGREFVPAAIGALTLSGWLARAALVIAEIGAHESPPSPPGFTVLDRRVYGAAQLLFWRSPS